MPWRPQNLVVMQEIIRLLTRWGVRRGWNNIKRAAFLIVDFGN